LKSAVALSSSAFGSAPPIMFVSAIPNVSRNSVTGSISGRPGRPILPEAMSVSTQSWGTTMLAFASASE
jgi:hypothetical protein